MTAQLAPPPVFSSRDNLGFPLVGGKLFTYAAGTTNPQATYVDSTQTTQNTNPVILNFRGEASVWLNPLQSYKFVLQDAFGNLIWTQDNIQGAINLNSDLLPAQDNTFNIGSALLSWKNGYFKTQLFVGPNLAPVYDSTTGNVGYYARTAAEITAGVTPVNFTYAPGEVQRQGCVGNGVTDDTAAFNRALSVGGWVHIPAGLNVLCSSGNANFALANTYLQLDGILTLTGTRLTAYSLNNIHIVGTGKIAYSATPTASSVPLGWAARGVVEWGGTDGLNGSPVAEAVGFVVRGIEIAGDFVGTPGSIAIAPTDQRRCIIVQNGQNIVIESNRIHGSTAEATLLLTTVASPGDFDMSVRGNTYYGNNHDCISQAGDYVYSFRAHNNTMYSSLNGIECNAGEFVGNYAFNMVGSGYGCGGNGNVLAGAPLIYRDNVSRNNGGNGFDLECATAAVGSLICQNNHSYNDGGFAFLLTFFDTIIFSGNTAVGWGRVATGSAFAANNSNFIHVDDNHCYEEGANSNGGFNFGALSGGQLIYGAGNTTSGVAIPYVADITTAQNSKPAPLPAFSQVSAHSLTGTLTPTTIYSAVIPAGSMSRSGGVEIVVGGTLTGVAGAKTINVQLGGTTVAQLSIAAATTGSWKATVHWMNSGSASTQTYTAETIQNNTLATGSSTTAINTATNCAVSVQVTLGNTGDTVTMNTFVVKQLNGLIS